MFDWLFEGRASIYVLCGAVTLALCALWYRNQRKKWLLAVAILSLAVTGIYTALDWAVETDSEQIRSRVQSMAAAVGRNDLNAAFAHISEQFRSPGGQSKSAFQEIARKYREPSIVTGIKVWEFDFPERPDQAGQRARVSFLVKVDGDMGRTQQLFARCEAVFDHDPAAGWRLRSFELFDPMRNNERVPFSY